MFRTPISLKPTSLSSINFDDPVLSIGSCFSDRIGQKLRRYKFNALVNPFGTLFNPLSITELLSSSLQPETFNPAYATEVNGVWHHHFLHSDVFASTKQELETLIQDKLKGTGDQLKNCHTLLITLGTAWVHSFPNNGAIVANCHKQQGFEKSLLSTSQIMDAFDALIPQLNNQTQIILTVSPVRHTREGLEENNLSKSILRVACHYLAEQHQQIEYFPAYEMLMDDLRDYRFYAEDMIHPSPAAETYIWEHFKKQYLHQQTQETIHQLEKLLKALDHKPFHENTEAHKKFLNETISKFEQLSGKVNVREEIERLQSKLD